FRWWAIPLSFAADDTRLVRRWSNTLDASPTLTMGPAPSGESAKERLHSIDRIRAPAGSVPSRAAPIAPTNPSSSARVSRTAKCLSAGSLRARSNAPSAAATPARSSHAVASPAVDAQALPVRPAPDVACLQTSACCHLDRSPGGVGVEVDEGGRMARAVGTEELQAGPAGEVLAAHPPSELHVGAAAVRAG